MADDVWIIGASMTKFGRYPDKDSIDLASEAALDALADAGATIHDMQMLAAGCLMEASNMLGQRLQKQIGQTASPSTTWPTPVPPGPPPCAPASWPSRRARPTWPWPSGSSRWGRWACWAAPGQARSAPTGYEPSGRYGSVMPVEGILGTQLMPGVFAQAGHGVRLAPRRGGLRAVRQGGREEPRPLGAQPAGAVPQGVQPRRGDGGGHGRLPQHPAHVLPHRRRRGRRWCCARTPSSRPSTPTSAGGP